MTEEYEEKLSDKELEDILERLSQTTVAIWDNPKACSALGVHLISCDEDGDCSLCGHQFVPD